MRQSPPSLTGPVRQGFFSPNRPTSSPHARCHHINAADIHPNSIAPWCAGWTLHSLIDMHTLWHPAGHSHAPTRPPQSTASPSFATRHHWPVQWCLSCPAQTRRKPTIPALMNTLSKAAVRAHPTATCLARHARTPLAAHVEC
jgi:hypothetical protein